MQSINVLKFFIRFTTTQSIWNENLRIAAFETQEVRDDICCFLKCRFVSILPQTASPYSWSWGYIFLIIMISETTPRTNAQIKYSEANIYPATWCISTMPFNTIHELITHNTKYAHKVKLWLLAMLLNFSV